MRKKHLSKLNVFSQGQAPLADLTAFKTGDRVRIIGAFEYFGFTFRKNMVGIIDKVNTNGEMKFKLDGGKESHWVSTKYVNKFVSCTQDEMDVINWIQRQRLRTWEALWIKLVLLGTPKRDCTWLRMPFIVDLNAERPHARTRCGYGYHNVLWKGHGTIVREATAVREQSTPSAAPQWVVNAPIEVYSQSINEFSEWCSGKVLEVDKVNKMIRVEYDVNSNTLGEKTVRWTSPLVRRPANPQSANAKGNASARKAIGVAPSPGRENDRQVVRAYLADPGALKTFLEDESWKDVPSVC